MTTQHTSAEDQDDVVGEKDAESEQAAVQNDSPDADRGVRSSALRAIASHSRGVADSSVQVRTLVVGAAMATLLVVVGVLGWQLHSKSNEVAAMQAETTDRTRAEQVALDYAVAAADMDFKDPQGWQERLTKGTTPELSNKLKQAANSMDQIISPLQWTSTSTPIVARVRSVSGGMYAVDCFVSVLTKNTQAPQGIQSTATYRLTLDKNHGWVITDVGGIDSALAVK